MLAKKQKQQNFIPYVLNSNRLFKDKKDIDVTQKEFYNYMQQLYYNQESYISILRLTKQKAERWSINTNEIEQLDRLQDLYNIYCSVNSMYCYGRHTSKYVKKLNALFLDIDYYSVPELQNLAPEQVVALMEMELDYPTPSYYISSGRGVYIIWLLESTYATAASKRFWKKLEKELLELFKDYGADPKATDPARVLRLIGSRNSKNDAVVKVIESPNYINNQPIRYELGEIAEFFWGSRDFNIKKVEEEKPKKKKKQTKKLIQLKNTYTLNYFRVEDLETLVELRKNQSMEGCREKLLFLYRLNLMYCKTDADLALQKTLKLNSKFLDPLEDAEVETATKTAEGVGNTYIRLMNDYKDDWDISLNKYLYNGGVYIYKNSTIIQELSISAEEQKYMKTIISPEEKKERKDVQNKEYYKNNSEKIKKERNKRYKKDIKSSNKLTKEQKKEQKIKDIKNLIARGMTQTQIATELGFSIATIKRYAKIIKENDSEK